MPTKKKLVVFIHGWSVTNTSTYGHLPRRLAAESQSFGSKIGIRQLFLSRYISFHDEIRLEDLSRALHAAVDRELSPLLEDDAYEDRFVCITHSTGGPVARDWWQRFYVDEGRANSCPMSHLIMLAPANFGSALAQLGKSRIGRLKSWAEGVEPGSGILDWLELGSSDAWVLNSKWICAQDNIVGKRTLFPFVITGQSIDRKLYDHLNTYTGEAGSDGVVRVASANLNSTYLRLEQQPAERIVARGTRYHAPALSLEETKRSPRVAFRVVPQASHSGNQLGIMGSVSERKGADAGKDIVSSILQCMQVETKGDYTRLCDIFDSQTTEIQEKELVEVVPARGLFSQERIFFHDRHSMVIIRLTDHLGHAVTDFDLILLAAEQGEDPSPNRLPCEFLSDRQRNSLNRSTLSMYFNYHAMTGHSAITNGLDPDDPRFREYREEWEGTDKIGLEVAARPKEGFVHYFACGLEASAEAMQDILKPNETTLVDIRMHRGVYKEVFQLSKGIRQQDFRKERPREILESGW